jgi:hypothetical protein
MPWAENPSLTPAVQRIYGARPSILLACAEPASTWREAGGWVDAGDGTGPGWIILVRLPPTYFPESSCNHVIYITRHLLPCGLTRPPPSTVSLLHFCLRFPNLRYAWRDSCEQLDERHPCYPWAMGLQRHNFGLAIICGLPVISAIFVGLRFLARWRRGLRVGWGAYLTILRILFHFVPLQPDLSANLANCR